MVNILISIDEDKLSGSSQSITCNYDDMELTEHEFLLTWVVKSLETCFKFDTIQFITKVELIFIYSKGKL